MKDTNQTSDKSGKNKKRIVLMVIAAAVIVIILMISLAYCNSRRAADSAPTPTESAEPSVSATASPAAFATKTAEPSKTSENAPVADKSDKTDVSSEKENPPAARQSEKPVSAETPKSTQKPTTHQHNWVDITETRKVLVAEAWDEDVYEERDKTVCNVCGKDISGNVSAHQKAHALADEGSGYHVEWYNVKTGTIHHDAEYKNETVVIGQKCSTCGATK